MDWLQGCLERLHRKVHPRPQVGDLDTRGPLPDEAENLRDPDVGRLLPLVLHPDLHRLLGGAPLAERPGLNLRPRRPGGPLRSRGNLDNLCGLLPSAFGREGSGRSGADPGEVAEETDDAMTSTGKRSIFTLDYFRSFIKFNIVGLTGVFVNEGLLIALQSVGVYVLTASAVAIEVSILSNFILNDFWTFRDRRSGHLVV